MVGVCTRHSSGRIRHADAPEIWSLFSKSLTTNGSSLNAKLVCETLGDRIVPTATPLAPDPVLVVGALTTTLGETGSPAQQPTPTDLDQAGTAPVSDPSALTGNEPVVGPSDPGSDNPDQQPAPQTPALSNEITDDLQPINAQPKKDTELKGPTTTIDFGNIQTGEKYRIRIDFINTKQGFDQRLARIDVSVGQAATVDQIVKNIKAELTAKGVPFSSDAKTPNVITFAWGKGGDKGGDLSKVLITLYSDVTPKNEPILNMKLDTPKWIGGTGSPEVVVDVNGKIQSTLPNVKPEEEESAPVEDDTNTPPSTVAPLAAPTRTSDTDESTFTSISIASPAENTGW